MADSEQKLPLYWRKRRTLHLPITLSVVLMTLNVAGMVCWIVLLAQNYVLSALTIGVIVMAISLFGLSFYVFLAIKEIQLNRRQANFVDSVTHELKTPIASLRLYLETMQMRDLEASQREEFCQIMESELQRLDHLINQLLEVGRLGEIGHDTAPEDVSLELVLRRCARTACSHHKRHEDEVFTFDVQPTVVRARRMVLEMIFGNLLDNAIKYSGDNPRVDVRVHMKGRGRVVTRILDNGEGVPADLRKKVFRIFYRGGNELERRQKGTGLGLYIVRTLTHLLKGQVNVYDRQGQPGSVFEVELPGKPEA